MTAYTQLHIYGYIYIQLHIYNIYIQPHNMRLAVNKRAILLLMFAIVYVEILERKNV